MIVVFILSPLGGGSAGQAIVEKWGHWLGML
jgi:hypothetical protein